MNCNYIYNNKSYTASEIQKLIENNPEQFLSTGQFLSKDVVSSKASPATLRKVKDFLKRIGVDIRVVEQIEVNGVKLKAGAIADPLGKLIEVVNGKQDIVLPEEAMHMATSIVKQTNPKLFSKMMKEIDKYDIYRQVYNTYSKYYRTKDGKPNVPKIKEEAIAKLLAETVIQLNEWATEKPNLQAKAQSWWQDILDFLRELFSGAGFNPFKTIATQVLEGTFEGTAADITENDGTYYSLDTHKDNNPVQTKLFDDIRATTNTVIKTPDGYEVNGVKVKNRVSDKSKAYYNNKFKGKQITKDEYTSALDEFRAQKGTDGHADMEDIFHRYVDDNGFLRESPLDKISVSQIDPKDERMYAALEENLKERLLTFPAGTRFMAETVVYDPQKDEAGTIDFMAITPTGEINILDWKFINLDTNKYTEIPFYKRDAFNIQIGEYKRILKDNYGATSFGMTRAIPIITKFSYKDKTYNLDSIRIGSVNVDLEEYDYLLPVPTKDERTQNSELNKLIDKLNALLAKVSSTPVKEGRKDIKKEQLSTIFKAIRDLQVKGSVDAAIGYSQILHVETDNLLKDFEEFKEVPVQEATDAQISEFAERILSLQDKFIPFDDIDVHLNPMFKGNEEMLNKISRTSSDVRQNLATLNNTLLEFSDKYLGERNNVANLLIAEREYKGASSYLRGPSKGGTSAITAFFRITNPAFQQTEIEKQKEYKRLLPIQEAYEKWAKGKGLEPKDMFDLIVKKDSFERVDTIDKQFFQDFSKAQADRDIQWFKDNIDIEKYQEWAKGDEQRRLSVIEGTVYDANTEVNNQRRSEEAQKVRNNYNLNAPTSPGWGYYAMKNFAKPKWYSAEYQELLKPENKPALDFFNYIEERINMGAAQGVIDPRIRRTFLPFVMKDGLAEKLAFGEGIKVGKSFIDGITINEQDTAFGYIDPLTGELKQQLPFYFRNEIEDPTLISKNLFSVMNRYNEQLIKYTNFKEIEEQVKALQAVERNKQSIQVNTSGKIIMEDGKPKLNPSNVTNSRVLDDLIKGVFYGQTYTDQALDKTLGTFGKTLDTIATKANNFLGTNIFPTNTEGRSVSAVKLVEGMNRLFQMKILGLNFAIPISNLIGGKLQGYINSGEFFDKKDWARAEWRFSTTKFNGEEGMKYAALLNYLVPFIEDTTRERGKKLSVSKVANASMSDFLFKFYRLTDKMVQGPIALAMLDNAVVVDGKLLNARKYIKSKYPDRYKLPAGERRKLNAQIEKEIEEIKKTSSLPNLAKVVDDELIIEGFDLNSKDMLELRSKITLLQKEATGAMTANDRNRINMTLLGRSFMTFKNWIPPLVYRRFSALKEDPGLDTYEWGRARMVGKIMFNEPIKGLKRLIDIYQANDNGVSYMQTMLQRKREQYLKDTGKELQITEEEFYDLMRQNVQSQMRDILFYMFLAGMFFAAKAAIPEAGEDDETRGFYIYGVRMLDKASDELAFYYNPLSFQQIANGSILPSLGVLTDAYNIMSSLAKESFGLVMQDDELVEKAHPTKYIMKAFPVANQMLQYLSIISPEFAKEHNIRLTTESRRR